MPDSQRLSLSGARLTRPQEAALHVLAEAHPKEVRGSKRRSQTTPIPLVNVRAAGALRRLGLAHERLPDPKFWSPYTCDSKFSITDAGIEVVAAWDARGSL